MYVHCIKFGFPSQLPIISLQRSQSVQTRRREGGGGDLPLAQQLISFAKHKNYYPLLSLLPAGSNHSRFIALTRKAITPLSHFSNTDVCSQHMQRLDCMFITCELFVLCFLALQVPSTFSYLSTSASRQQTALSSPFCHRTALMFDFSLG